MFESLIETLWGAYRPKEHRGLLEALWEQERWFDTPRQFRAAEVAREALLEGGIRDARLDPFAADGRTRFQDWMTHLAWECPSASLALADNADVLADRASCPTSVVYWSGPLAGNVVAGRLPRPEPVRGQATDGDALAELTPRAVNGKYVLTAKPAVEMKRRLVAGGALLKPLAVVSDFLGTNDGYTETTTRWCNTWSDGPDGWYVHAADAVMPGFCLSPAAGKRLRRRLAENPELELLGHCASRLYEGAGQCVTGLLPGASSDREIWLYAHACEEGAHDNCAGVSVIVEAVRLLRRLIVAGKLPQPRRGIRVVTTEECIGMAAFATRNEDLRRRALAGLNVDGAGGPSSPEIPFGLTYGPMSAPSIGWAAAALLGEVLAGRAQGGYHVRPRFGVPTADDMIADPNCGVPSLWLGQGGNCWGYHSSADTPGICTDESLSNNTLLAAAWAYTLAALDERTAAELAPAAARWIDAQLVRPGGDDPAKRDAAELSRWTAAGLLRDIKRWGIPASAYEAHAGRYAAVDQPPLPGLPGEGLRYKRTAWGTCTFETLPIEERKFGRWSEWATAALYWTDGRRPLAAVERLVRAETGRTVGLEPLFELCVEAGLAVRR